MGRLKGTHSETHKDAMVGETLRDRRRKEGGGSRADGRQNPGKTKTKKIFGIKETDRRTCLPEMKVTEAKKEQRKQGCSEEGEGARQRERRRQV